MTIDVSSAKDLTTLHSSYERLEKRKLSWVSIKFFFSTWIKNTSRLGCPSGGFQEDFLAKAGVSIKSCEAHS